MLPKKQRIDRQELGKLFKNSKVLVNDLFLFRFDQNNSSLSKFSFSVSKKVAKNAVLRNKMRRMGYRSVAEIYKDLKTNIVGQFTFKAVPKGIEEVKDNILKIFKKLDLIK